MDTFLTLSSADQLDAYVEVNRAMGLDAASVEKDFWVCWTLREIFSHPDLGSHITFKGGTSLSKAWKLIQRFSEDIDLIIDKEVLGFGGDAAPDKAPSNKQRKARLENLMNACRDWVQQTLQPALASRMQTALGENGWKLEVDPDMDDGQCLLFHYPTVFPNSVAAYVRPVVKIELGARSDDWPHEEKSIESYVTEHFPTLDPKPSFEVRVLSAERTFWAPMAELVVSFAFLKGSTWMARNALRYRFGHTAKSQKHKRRPRSGGSTCRGTAFVKRSRGFLASLG